MELTAALPFPDTPVPTAVVGAAVVAGTMADVDEAAIVLEATDGISATARVVLEVLLESTETVLEIWALETLETVPTGAAVVEGASSLAEAEVGAPETGVVDSPHFAPATVRVAP